MIRYVLLMPKQPWERPERPRREVVVSLSSEASWKLAPLQFRGEEKDIQTVHDTLVYQATGARGAIIEEETTPLHLAVAMDSPVMSIFQPERLEGGKLFQPAASAVDEDLNRLAETIARLFIDTLPLLPSFDNQARSLLIERLRFILALCEALCSDPECPENAGTRLASLINNRLVAANIDHEQMQQLLRASSKFLAIVLLEISQTGQQVAAMLHRLAQLAGEPGETSIRSFCAEIGSIWRADIKP